jgi:hypothetical protein
LLVALFGFLVFGCGASLTDAEALWCQDNSNKVVGAARVLGIAKDPGWVSRCNSTAEAAPSTGDVHTQLMSGAQSYYQCAGSDSEYIAACRAVAKADGGPPVKSVVLSAAEIAFCENEANWSATRARSLSMGQQWEQSKIGTPTWVMRGVAANDLRGDGDYVRACKTAFQAV